MSTAPGTAARPSGPDEPPTPLGLFLRKQVGFQRSALLLGADNFTRMRTRTAVGEGQEFLSDAPDIVLQPPNGSMAVSLLRREDLFADLKPGSPHRADPSVKRLRSATFILFPVIVAGQPIGAIFADSVRTPVPLPAELQTTLLGIRDALCLAFDRLREKAAASAAPTRPSTARSVSAA